MLTPGKPPCSPPQASATWVIPGESLGITFTFMRHALLHWGKRDTKKNHRDFGDKATVSVSCTLFSRAGGEYSWFNKKVKLAHLVSSTELIVAQHFPKFLQDLKQVGIIIIQLFYFTSASLQLNLDFLQQIREMRRIVHFAVQTPKLVWIPMWNYFFKTI